MEPQNVYYGWMSLCRAALPFFSKLTAGDLIGGGLTTLIGCLFNLSAYPSIGESALHFSLSDSGYTFHREPLGLLSASMTLSICIVNWNTRDYLCACLTSIDAHPPNVPYEVIVVDNASQDGSAEMVRQRFPQVRLITNSENAGYAAGNNQAIRTAQGSFVLLLNPDTEVYEDTLHQALHFLQSHPEAGALGALQRLPNGAVQPSVRAFPYPLLLFFEIVGLSRLFPRHPLFASYRMGAFRYDRVQEVDQPMGTFLMVRREVVQQVGPLDEDFPLFFNDVDWCYRIKHAGWKIYFVPDVVILHHGGASTSQIRRAAIRESHRALELFYRKHFRGRIPALPFACIIGMIRFGTWIRLLFAKK